MNGDAARKLLERMRATKSGWGQDDFERLLTGFGFTCKGKRHGIYAHPVYKDLWISVPRHAKLKKWVAVDAVKLIDKLLELQGSEESNGHSSQGS